MGTARIFFFSLEGVGQSSGGAAARKFSYKFKFKLFNVIFTDSPRVFRIEE
jgi:hypothetical protein